MADTPPTPRPGRKPAGSSGATRSEPVTPDTPVTPPKQAPPKKPAASRGLQRSLEELFSAPALAYSMAGDEWAASFVAERAPILAEAWYKLSLESPAVKRILVKLTTGSAWGGVIAASLMTMVPLLAHHGLLPEGVTDLALSGATEGGGPDRPIVPPPPAPSGSPSPPDMTPPVAPGAPPGVVTVAGSNAAHSGAR